MVVDCAHYVEGVRQHEGAIGLDEAAARARERGGFVWVGLLEPDEAEMGRVSELFGLHELAVEDAHRAHQRPKIEDYDDSYFVVLRTAFYDDEREAIEFGEIHLFLSATYAIVIRHGRPAELGPVRARLEARPELLAHGPGAVAWGVLDHVVDGYLPVVEGLDNDIDEVEEAVFESGTGPTARIHFLRRELLQFHHAVTPLLGPLTELERGVFAEIPEQLRRYFRDVSDHATRVAERVAAQRELLTGVLEASLALITLRQNEVVQKISGWAAVIAVPTFIASVYGMNFRHMPELGWGAGYPLSLGLMLAVGTALWVFFKRVGWL